MKYVIEIKELDVRPDEWTRSSEWPGEGIYSCRGDTSLYSVHKWGVDYVAFQDNFIVRPITDKEFSPAVTELLFLKAIAAASRAEVLK